MPLNDVGAGLEIPDGVYTLQVAEPLEDAKPGQFGPRMKWQYWVWDAEGNLLTEDGRTWWQFTGTATGPRSAARPILEALLARELAKGDTGEVLSNLIVGCNMMARIETNEAGYANIEKVWPHGTDEPGKAKKPAAPPALKGAAPAAAKAPTAAKAPAAPAAAPKPAAVDPEAEADPFEGLVEDAA